MISRNSWFALLTLVLFVSPVGVSPIWADDAKLAEARRHFERSQEAGLSSTARLEWLERSVGVEPTFTAFYEMGKVRQEGDHRAALEAFSEAFELAADDRYRAQAAYQAGRTHLLMDHWVEARQWLRRSLELHDHAEVREALRRLELQRRGDVLSADEIQREMAVTRSFSVEAGTSRADLRVHFELNSAQLDAQGRRQADELGRALTNGRSIRRKDFLVLGHTDRLCPRGETDRRRCDQFNLELSQRRADAVRDYLVRYYPLTAADVRTLGCGRQYLMSQRDSSDDHYLNRRVTVMALGSSTVVLRQLCARGSGLF